MSQDTPRYNSGMMESCTRREVQQNPQGRFPPVDPNAFEGEIQRLSSLLEMEKARRYEDNQKLAHLQAELEDTKLQLKRQKAVKGLHLNKSKEATRKLEEKFSETVLNAPAIASKVHNTKKYKKKKVLQQELEELNVTHHRIREAFMSEILAEREKSKALQKELDRAQTSFDELHSKFEAYIAVVRQEAEAHKLCEARFSEKLRLLENLRAGNYELFQEMSQQIAVLQDSEKRLQKELNQLKFSYNELNWKYKSDVSGLKQDVETYGQEVSHEKEANLQRANENLQIIDHLTAEKEEVVQKMSREITILEKREKDILNKYDQVLVSYEQLKSRHETDITAELQQQAERFQQKIKEETALCNKKMKDEELIHERNYSALQQQIENLELQIDRERKAYLQKTTENVAFLDDIRANNAVLDKNLTNVIQLLQEKEQGSQAELENLKGLYQDLKCRYETDVSALKQQAHEKEEKDSQSQGDLVPSEEKLSRGTITGCSSNPESKISAETILDDLDHPHTQTMHDGKKKKSKFSIWKKVQNALRLKKSKREKSVDI